MDRGQSFVHPLPVLPPTISMMFSDAKLHDAVMGLYRKRSLKWLLVPQGFDSIPDQPFDRESNAREVAFNSAIIANPYFRASCKVLSYYMADRQLKLSGWEWKYCLQG